jgi:hypothetical protein
MTHAFSNHMSTVTTTTATMAHAITEPHLRKRIKMTATVVILLSAIRVFGVHPIYYSQRVSLDVLAARPT